MKSNEAIISEMERKVEERIKLAEEQAAWEANIKAKMDSKAVAAFELYRQFLSLTNDKQVAATLAIGSLYHNI